MRAIKPATGVRPVTADTPNIIGWLFLADHGSEVVIGTTTWRLLFKRHNDDHVGKDPAMPDVEAVLGLPILSTW